MNPLRSALLEASTNPFLSRRLPRMRFVRRAARRFMPGEEPEDALREAEALKEEGASSLLTLLGENVEDASAAEEVVQHYLGVLERVRDRGLDAELSVKLTQLGLDLGTDTAIENLRMLVGAAAPDEKLVWVDMESSPYVDRTLEVFRTLRQEFENVGVCLQAYLYRTEEDLEALLPLKPAIRIVKGAYREPDDVAYPSKKDVDRNYVKLARRLLEARARGEAGRPGFGTHDPAIVREVAEVADGLGLPPDRWEVEMLYGIGVGDQRRFLERGLTLRVLISYGDHWFPWYMRRLAERPANLWFVMRKMVGL